MTREHFIREWLGNPTKQYTEYDRNEMRDDLDKVCEHQNKDIKAELERSKNYINWMEKRKEFIDWYGSGERISSFAIFNWFNDKQNPKK